MFHHLQVSLGISTTEEDIKLFTAPGESRKNNIQGEKPELSWHFPACICQQLARHNLENKGVKLTGTKNSRELHRNLLNERRELVNIFYDVLVHGYMKLYACLIETS